MTSIWLKFSLPGGKAVDPRRDILALLDSCAFEPIRGSHFQKKIKKRFNPV
jgi:hypothetical protein